MVARSRFALRALLPLLAGLSPALAAEPAPHMPPESDLAGLLFVFMLASFIGLGVILLVLAFLRTRLDLEGLLFASSVLAFAFYMLPTSTHERYLYPMFAFAAPLIVRHRWLAVPYVALSLTFILNLLAINPPTGAAFWDWHGTHFAIAIAAFHTAMFAAILAMLAVLTIRERLAQRLPQRRAAPQRDRVPAWMSREAETFGSTPVSPRASAPSSTPLQPPIRR